MTTKSHTTAEATGPIIKRYKNIKHRKYETQKAHLKVSWIISFCNSADCRQLRTDFEESTDVFFRRRSVVLA